MHCTLQLTEMPCHESIADPSLHQEDVHDMHDVLGNLQHQLWLTVFIYPLGDNLYPERSLVERKLDSVQSGLHSKLQDCYSRFAFHFQDAERAGTLINEAAFWLGWMRSLRQHLIRIRERTTNIPNDQASLATWRTQCAANFLVRVLSICSQSACSALTRICTASEPWQPWSTGQGSG